MVRYRASWETSQPRETAFAYLSDFANAREWDPSVITAERLSDGPLGEGAEFRFETEFFGRMTPLIYRVVRYDPPAAVTFRAETSVVVSEDAITLENTPTGTRITYDAALSLKGTRRVSDAVLRVALTAIRDRARDRLRRRLPPVPPTVLAPLEGRAPDGRRYRLPDDLDTAHSFLVVAFRPEQWSLVDGWLRWLSDFARCRSGVAIYEVMILGSDPRPWHRRRHGETAQYNPAAAAPVRSIAIHTDVREAAEDLGLAGTDTVAVLSVAGPGNIEALVSGGFDVTKAKRLAAALGVRLPPVVT